MESPPPYTLFENESDPPDYEMYPSAPVAEPSTIWTPVPGTFQNPNTNQHVWNQGQNPNTNQHLWIQGQNPNTNQHLWIQGQNPNTSQHLWTQGQNPNTSQHLWTQGQPPGPYVMTQPQYVLRVVSATNSQNDYCAWSVANFLFCNIFLGIAAIIYSSKSRESFASGRPEEGQSKAGTARTLNIISMALGLWGLCIGLLTLIAVGIMIGVLLV